jgi:ribosomal protein L11 methyltransferase
LGRAGENMATGQDYLEVRVCVSESQVAAVEALMQAQGALAVTLTDFADVPVLEPPVGETPLWPDVIVCGLFSADVEKEPLQSVLSLAPGVEAPDRVLLSTVQDRDWLRAWQKSLEPMQFGRNLWIVPSHCEPRDPSATNLRLDPGLAFGSGTHPSTRLCLEWIDGQDFANGRVVDFGCGSGILAVAAAMKGAALVIGVDNDPQALIATRENARHNRVAERILAMSPEEFGTEPVDVVLANILSGTLIELAPQLMAAVRPGGWLVLAGILDHQSEAVCEAYSERFARMERVRHGDWVRLAGRAPG